MSESEELQEAMEGRAVLAGDAGDHDAAGLRLDLHAAKFRAGAELPRAGSRLLLLARVTVVTSATEDSNRDGHPESLHFVVKVDSFAAETLGDEDEAEEIERKAQELIAERDAELERRAKVLYESPRRKVGERSVGGTPWTGEHGPLNRRYGG